MRRPALFVVGLLVLLVAVLGWLWFRGEGPGRADIADVPAANAPAESAAPVTLEGAASQRDAATAALPNPTEAPPSYLAALGTLTGRVVDVDRTPVAGISVELMGGNVLELLPTDDALFDDELPSLKLSAGATKTGADGRFRFERVDPRGFFLLAVGIGGPRAKLWPVVAMPNPGETADVGDIVLDPYAIFTGRVVDEEGEPVPGARVRAAANLPSEAFDYGIYRVAPGCAVAGLVPTDNQWMLFQIPPFVTDFMERLPFPETATDADGVFRLEGVPLGLAMLVIEHGGLVPLVRGPFTTEDGGETDLGTLEMEHGLAVTGTVIDGEGRPVEGATVLIGERLRIWPAALLLPAHPTAVTGKDGRFTADGLRDVEHEIAVRAKDATSWVFTHDVLPGDDTIVRLEETFALTVTARDQQGTIVPRPRVAIRRADPLADAGPLVVPPVELGSRLRHTDEGAVVVRGLSRGSYHVFVTKDGFAVSRTEATVGSADGTPAEANVVLEPELVGHVQVVAAGTGKPIEYALVSAHEPVAEGEEDDFPFRPAMITRRTDENGFAFLPRLQEGSLPIDVFHPAYASADATLVAPGPPIVVTLRQGGTIAGRVLQNGAAVTEPYVVLAFGGELSSFRLGMTGDDGTFRVTHLAEGVYQVVANRYASLAERNGEGGGGLRVNSRDGSSGGGEEGVFRFKVGDSDASGAPGTEGDDIDADVHAGTRVEGDAGVEAVVAEGRETWVDIDVMLLGDAGPKGRLAGSVLLNAQPGAGLVVTASATAGAGRSRSGNTDASGRFDLGEVPAGEITVEVSRRDDELLAVQKLVLEPGETKDLRLELECGSLNGKVTSAKDGRAIGHARVLLMPITEEGQAAASGELATATAEDGRFAFDVVPRGKYMVMAQRTGLAKATVGPVDVPARLAPPPVRIEMIEAVRVQGTVELPPGAGAAPYLFVYLDGGDGGIGSFSFVDPVSRTFTLDDVVPGDYEVRVFGTERGLRPLPLKVPDSGTSSVILRPELE